MTSTGRRGFVGIDRRWLANTALSDGALRLMCWLDSHSDEYLARMNVSSTADSLGWGRPRVMRTIKQLEDLGLISTEQMPREHGGTITRFTLHLDRWTDVSPRYSAMYHGDARAVYHGDTPSSSNPIVEESTLETPKPPATTEAVVLELWEVFFNHFWEAYPRKVGKVPARKAMKAKCQPHLMDDIAKGTREWIGYWAEAHTEEQYIPHPSTFLNQERYLETPPKIDEHKKDSAMDIIARIAARDS